MLRQINKEKILKIAMYSKQSFGIFRNFSRRIFSVFPAGIDPARNKKGVSLMVSYVLLVSIVIMVSIGVFSWLNTMANVEPAVDCKEGTSVILESYSCDTGVFEMSIKNNGRFNVTGVLVLVSDDLLREPEYGLMPFGKIANWGYYFFDESLGPGDIEAGVLFSSESKSGTLEKIVEVRIQPFVVQNGDKVICSEAVIKQSVDCDLG